jgi:hypothetical protein
MIDEVAKSPSRPRTYLVNPRYGEIGGGVCYPALADLPEPADLPLLTVPDAALEEQVRSAAAAGARSRPAAVRPRLDRLRRRLLLGPGGRPWRAPGNVGDQR